MSFVNLIREGNFTQDFSDVQLRFSGGWKGTATPPFGILAAYRIQYLTKSTKNEATQPGYLINSNYSTYKAKIGREVRRFCSIQRACTLGEANNKTLCNIPSCSLCLLLKNRTSLEEYGDFGMGFYTTERSSKATEDSENILIKSSKVKVILQCKVSLGKTQTQSTLPKNPSAPVNSGFNSIHSTVSQHPQDIVFSPDALLPEFLVVVSPKAAPPPPVNKIPGLDDIEKEIEKLCQKSGGGSQFFRFGSSGYKDSVRHFFESSSERANSAVQPGSKQVLSAIMKLLNKTEYNKVPFAVKGGGHATNPGFSSTDGGIQIYMARFDQVEYDQSTKTVKVGAGALWDEVYLEIAKYNRSAVGGARMGGVGVGGYLSGGGYSILSNTHGLGIDNIRKFEVVLPSGTIVETFEGDTANPNLFQALKGGGCNFGIITSFTLETYDQKLCWTSAPGLAFKGLQARTTIKKALVDFATNYMNPRAVAIGTFRWYFEPNNPNPVSDVDLFFFYDGDYSVVNTKSSDPFKDFKVCDTIEKPIKAKSCELDQKTFDEATKTFGEAKEQKPQMSGVGEIKRGRFACIMVTGFDQRLIDEMEKQAMASSNFMKGRGGIRILIDVWPFHKDMYKRFTDAAWPHKAQKTTFGHLLLYYTWEGTPEDPKVNDAFWIKNMKDALDKIKIAAGKFYNPTLPVYLNTALSDYTTVKDIYQGKLTELRTWKRLYDKNNVMARAGGFVI